MEKTKSRLPVIFKFSMLWNILPYYGYLDEWERLLAVLNKCTRLFWNEHRKAFKVWGKELMRSLYFTDASSRIPKIYFDVFKVFIEYSILSTKSRENQKAKNFISKLVKMLDQNEAIFIENINIDYEIARVSVIQNEEISDIIPAMSCSAYKPNKRSFRLNRISDALIKHILFQIQKMSVAIKCNRNKIEVYSFIIGWYNIFVKEKPALWKVQQEVDRILESCPVNNWVWKPNRLKIFGFNAELLNRIEQFSYLPAIKEFKINLFAFWEDRDFFMTLISKYKEVAFNVDIFMDLENNQGTGVEVFEEELVFVFDGNMLWFKLEIELAFQLKYSSCIIIDDALVGLKIEKISADNWILKRYVEERFSK